MTTKTSRTKTGYEISRATIVRSGNFKETGKKGAVLRFEDGTEGAVAYEAYLPFLRGNAEASNSELEAQGYKRGMSIIAGDDSGSTWSHQDGRQAEINCRQMNRITYGSPKADKAAKLWRTRLIAAATKEAR